MKPTVQIKFNVRYDSVWGQNLYLIGSCDALGNWGRENAIPLIYTAPGEWSTVLHIPDQKFEYTYLIHDEKDNSIEEEWSHHFYKQPSAREVIYIYDDWLFPSLPEFNLNTDVFEVIGHKIKKRKLSKYKKNTHRFCISFRPLGKNEALYILGNHEALGSWYEDHALLMSWDGNGSWSIDVNLANADDIVAYKYLVKNTKTGKVLYYETGQNRKSVTAAENEFIIQNDTFFRQPTEYLWRGSGIAVPVFSLRSEKGCGVGEFLDLIDLGKWAKKAGFSIIQILPIHDTIATKDWTDSYPYAAISVYALHPMYLRITDLCFKLDNTEKEKVKDKTAELNELEFVDYEAVTAFKMDFLKQYFEKHISKIYKKTKFKKFYKKNKDWIRPYALFSVLRDEYGTPDFTKWKKHSSPSKESIKSYFKPKHDAYNKVMFYVFVQWQLHEQLSKAVKALHKMKICLKGDLPIGIYRYSVEAWWRPKLFNLQQQAGAPPDDFAILGQNWEFPTYDWDQMQKDNFCWWKSRLQFMSRYFDAYRIDHILGFFRIWQIPISATQGILGRFEPALPISLKELRQRGIFLNLERLITPYIDDEMLQSYFGTEVDELIDKYFDVKNDNGEFVLKEEFSTQRKIKEALGALHPHLEALLEIAANVLFIKENTDEIRLHPRFHLIKTISFKRLDIETQAKIKDLYLDYFFIRHEQFWKNKGLEKLPKLKQATQMLACGEDLGLVPKVVPEVLHELAILSLEIQRMPSEEIDFSHPKNAPYLSVVSPSSHDTSTLRQWWQEKTTNTQFFYNHLMELQGDAPTTLSPELVEIIIDQHLHSPAMFSIIPIQDILALSKALSNPKENTERINIPAVFPHYWRYRMHLTIEELNKHDDFTQRLHEKHRQAGRLI